MDIAQVRKHFQKPVDFLVLSSSFTNLAYATYNLSQATIKDKITLHITNEVDPDLTGHLIAIANQEYLVYRPFNEPMSYNHYTYELLPATATIGLAEITTSQNAIGSSKPVLGALQFYKVFIYQYAAAEIQRPSLQVNQMYQQEFALAVKQFDDTKDYKLYYAGRYFNIKARLFENGIVKLSAIEDH